MISLSRNAVRTFHQSASFVVATTISTSLGITDVPSRAAPRRLSLTGSKINETLSPFLPRGGRGNGGETRKRWMERERERERETKRERNCVSRVAKGVSIPVLSPARSLAPDGRETPDLCFIQFSPRGSPIFTKPRANDIRGANRPANARRSVTGQCRRRRGATLTKVRFRYIYIYIYIYIYKYIIPMINIKDAYACTLADKLRDNNINLLKIDKSCDNRINCRSERREMHLFFIRRLTEQFVDQLLRYIRCIVSVKSD